MLGHHNLMTAGPGQQPDRGLGLPGRLPEPDNRLNFGAVVQRYPYRLRRLRLRLRCRRRPAGPDRRGDPLPPDQLRHRRLRLLSLQPLPELRVSGGLQLHRLRQRPLRYAYTDYDGFPIYVNEKSQLPTPPGIHWPTLGAALVYDTAYSGPPPRSSAKATGFEITPTFGTLNFYTRSGRFPQVHRPGQAVHPGLAACTTAGSARALRRPAVAHVSWATMYSPRLQLPFLRPG